VLVQYLIGLGTIDQKMWKMIIEKNATLDTLGMYAVLMSCMLYWWWWWSSFQFVFNLGINNKFELNEKSQ